LDLSNLKSDPTTQASVLSINLFKLMKSLMGEKSGEQKYCPETHYLVTNDVLLRARGHDNNQVLPQPYNSAALTSYCRCFSRPGDRTAPFTIAHALQDDAAPAVPAELICSAPLVDPSRS
jgi:hypothetical protein